MAVNTINELIALLDLVDLDALVLAAIANDSPTSVANGPGPGLVTTRLGTNVKNVQKVLADIENGITIGIRPAIQEEGTTILDNPATINFVGGNITVTDVSGVATITVSGEVTKVGTPVDNQVGVWTGDGTLEGGATLTFDGAVLSVTADAGPTFNLVDGNDAVTFTSAIINPGTPVAIFGTTTAHDLRVMSNNIARLSITSAGLVGIGTALPNKLLTLNAEDPTIRFQDISSSNVTEIITGDAELTLSLDPTNVVANSAIVFNIDGSEVGRFNSIGNLDLVADGYITATKQVNAQTGTAYTIILDDINAVVTMSNGAGNTLTIPTNAAVAFPIGTELSVQQIAVGATSVAGDTGVTLNGVSAGTGAITAQWDDVRIRKIATDTWTVAGSIGAVA